MKVYRVQNAKGEGPYEMPFVWDVGGGPLPEDDFGDFRKLRGYKFAFVSPEHADRWFDEAYLAVLALGFGLYEYDTTDVVQSDSKSQVLVKLKGKGKLVTGTTKPKLPLPRFDDEDAEAEWHRSFAKKLSVGKGGRARELAMYEVEDASWRTGAAYEALVFAMKLLGEL